MTPTPTVKKKKKPAAPLCRSCLAVAKQSPGWTVHTAYCLHCVRCDGCGCACVQCSCGRRVSMYTAHYCKHCRMCKKCCACRAMPKWTAPNKLGTLGTTTRINTLPRALGIELEIGEWGTLTSRRFKHIKYNPVHDGSVRPSETEMVLKPMYGDGFITGMTELAEGLYISDVEMNKTCALHVHVAATDLSYWELRRLLMVYERIEGDIFRYLVAPYRGTEPTVVHFCQWFTRPHEYCEKCRRFDELYPGARQSLEPLDRTLARMALARSTSDLKVCLIRMLYGIDDASARPNDFLHHKGGRYEWARYRSLNLHSWLYRGTVEFRMKEATTDVEELMYWPLWCGWVVHAITKMNDTEARSEKMGLRYLTERYMPKYLAEWVERKIAAVKGTTV